MKISVIKHNIIDNIILPDNIDGSYWISDTDNSGISRNLISIEADNNKWKLCSNKEVYYFKDNTYIPNVYLEINNFYTIKNESENYEFLIYCSSKETTYDFYNVSENLNNGIIIGNSENSTITYSLLGGVSCVIKSDNNIVSINENLTEGNTHIIYVNNVLLNKSEQLKNGDIIFIMGMKIMFLSLVNKGKIFYYLGVGKNVNNVVVKNMMSTTLPDIINAAYDEPEEEIEYPLYDEKEYFSKTPRFVNQIKTFELNIDAPPAKQEDNTNSVLLTIGPMLTMSMTSLVTGYTALNNVLSGDSTWQRATPSLIICFAMFASVFIWPIFSKRYEKKLRKKNEKKRQEKYTKYIEEKRQIIIKEKNDQSNILRNNYPSVEECTNVILTPLTSLWQRKLEDYDFLDLNLGVGNCPMKIDIKYPEDHFSMVEDNLKDIVSNLGNEPKTLSQVPIVFSLLENPICGIVGKRTTISEYTRQLLIQVLAHHSYDNLKIVILTDEENEYNWKFLKTIPHIFTDDRNLRFFASNNDDYKEVLYYIDKIFEQRKEQYEKTDIKIEDLKTAYLIITDSLKKVKNFDVLEKILDSKKNYGFFTMILDEKITNLPEQCESFIKMENENGELIYSNDLSSIIKFQSNINSYFNYEKIGKKLSNIPIYFKNKDEGQLPAKVGFLEMYDVGKIEQLNALARWQNSNPMQNLAAPVGIGKSSEKINIDLHEKYHGPHGLVAGMTGSGKSEFIITYILSMAINYHPNEVQFILIDYKGGGLAGAFENASIGLKLPHLVGTITNLDANEIKRSLSSIESELKRRQGLFNTAREKSGESTVDIYKYQKMYRNKIVDEPVSHLFIICDEFAELKNQQPEFMEQLISTARIGRSLGVHLILATQKPSGVVDPQIWSNTRFRVCMRVQDKSDSNEVIKCNDAAFLKQTGRFYFQVGYNEVFVLGQSAWAGGKYQSMDKVNKTIDTSIDFINNVGYSIKNIETRAIKENNSVDVGEELINIVKYLSDIAKEQNIICKPLWLEKIPPLIKVDQLVEKYNYEKISMNINPIIGEYDIPSNQQQCLLTLPLSKEGNALIYGSSGAGKENFITTIIYSSMLYYTPNEINYYILDFGSEALKMFNNCPIVGNVLNIDDEERIENLYKMLAATIEERKELFAEYNGDFETYCANSGKTVPNIVVVINNYESYQENYGKYDDILIVLSRDCNRYGIYFVITVNTPNGIRFKLKQNFALTYVLQQNSDEDYTTILGNVHKTFPAKIFGRGIIKKDEVYEFQTASVCENENISKTIKELNEQYSHKYDIIAKSVPVLPKTVGYQEISKEFAKSDELIIGINKDDLLIHKFDFTKNYTTIISALDVNEYSDFINCLINQIIVVNNKSLVVINAEEMNIIEKNKTLYQYVDNKFDEIFTNLLDFTKNQKDKYIEANYDKSVFENKKPVYCVIIGIDNFKNRLNPDNKTKFGELFDNPKDLETINYIIIDSIDKIKKVELDSWYKSNVNNTNGIWLGDGINDQFSIKISQKTEEMKEKIPLGFCFVIYKGKAEYVKYVSELDLKF